MGNALIIRPLDNSYCPEIINLILPIQQIEFNVPVTLEDQPDLKNIEVNYIADGGGFWGALIDNQLIGTIALINTGHQAGTIRKMFVKKEWRGKEYGIGGRLLDTLLQYCRQRGISQIYLGTVNKLQAAIRFYEKHGFNEVAKNDLPDYFPRMQADNIFFHLHLQHPGNTDTNPSSSSIR